MTLSLTSSNDGEQWCVSIDIETWDATGGSSTDVFSYGQCGTQRGLGHRRAVADALRALAAEIESAAYGPQGVRLK